MTLWQVYGRSSTVAMIAVLTPLTCAQCCVWQPCGTISQCLRDAFVIAAHAVTTGEA